MKKLLTLLLAVVMAATLLAGCGGQSANTAGENSTPQTEKKGKGGRCLLGQSDAGFLYPVPLRPVPGGGV